MVVRAHHRRRRGLRRLRRRIEFPFAFLALLLVLALCTYNLARYGWIVAQVPRVLVRNAHGIEIYEPMPTYRSSRRSYPYSVVNGGLASVDELEQSVHADPVVARHYAGIYPTAMEMTRLAAPIQAYASYRIGNHVYWTQKTITVPRGELILSDGTHMIRARCGNRLTFLAPPPQFETPIPGMPAEPVPEPPEQVFEYGMPPIIVSPEMPVLIAGGTPPPVNHFWPPAIFPPLWCCGPGGAVLPPLPYPRAQGGRPLRPAAPPPAVPEPSTVVLLGAGAAALAVKLKLTRG